MQLMKFGNGYVIQYPTFDWACNYLAMLWLKFIRVSKGDPWSLVTSTDDIMAFSAQLQRKFRRGKLYIGSTIT